MKWDAVVIGAGMGGLATALRLRHHGFEVNVFEKQPRPGGRSYIIEEDGYRVDTGPTILVMKDTFEELYDSLGLSLHERLALVQLDPNYRIYFHDHSSIDLFSDAALRECAVSITAGILLATACSSSSKPCTPMMSRMIRS